MSNEPTTRSASASLTALVDAYVEAWNTRDGAAVVATLAPGGTYLDPLLPGPASGDVLAGFVSALAAAIPDFRFTWSVYDCTDHAFALWMMSGTHTGELPGVPGPTGASFELPGSDFFSFDEHGITSVVGYFDQMTLFRQLGIDAQLSIAEHD